MQRFGVKGMVRPSLAFYNTFAEIDALVAAVYKARKALA
jgi:cysteine desulfurase/selenocysteine lyase